MLAPLLFGCRISNKCILACPSIDLVTENYSLAPSFIIPVPPKNSSADGIVDIGAAEFILAFSLFPLVFHRFLRGQEVELVDADVGVPVVGHVQVVGHVEAVFGLLGDHGYAVLVEE